MKDSLGIYIPLYNEEEGIPNLKSELIELQEKLEEKCNFEIILIDDGSFDSTQELLQENFRDYPYRVITHSENKNLDYVEDNKKNIKVVKKYHKNINKFIDDLCYLDNYLKIKEIINFNKKKNIFKVVLIISCRIKNE